MEEQVVVIFAGTRGYLNVPLADERVANVRRCRGMNLREWKVTTMAHRVRSHTPRTPPTVGGGGGFRGAV
jgi:hypothetical protein